MGKKDSASCAGSEIVFGEKVFMASKRNITEEKSA
jgi:hypothetical protein